MAGPQRLASSAHPVTPRGTRPRLGRVGAVAVAAILAACSAAQPSGSPSPTTSVPTVVPSAPPAQTPAATAAGTPDVIPNVSPPAGPTPSPTPGADGWSPVEPAPALPIGMELAAVRGAAAAMDAAAGFRLRATGDVALATLLARLRVEPAFDYRVATDAGGRSAVLRPVAELPAGARYRFTLLDPKGSPLTGWAFQVGGPLHVVGTIPHDESVDVPPTTGIEISFDRDGVALAAGDVVVRRISDRSLVRGALERHGRATVFVPAARLQAGSVYQVTIRTGAGAADGLPGLPQAVSFAFRIASQARAGSRHATFEETFVSAIPGERALVQARAWQALRDGDRGLSTPVRLRVYRLKGESPAVQALTRMLDVPAWLGSDGRPTISTSGLTAGLRRPGVLRPRGLGAAPADPGGCRSRLVPPGAARERGQPGDPAGHRRDGHGRLPRRPHGRVGQRRANRRADPERDGRDHRRAPASVAPMQPACWSRRRRRRFPNPPARC